MAAGLALSGYQVFVYSIAPFLAYRAFEQIRNDLCYQNLPVKIIGVGGGLAYGNAGPSHHATEDIALMTSIPNMSVICPGDPLEVSYAIKESIKLKGPAYIRLNRSGDDSVHLHKQIDFKIGRGIVLSLGNEVLILSTGNTLPLASQVCNRLNKHGISAELISMHTLKPFDHKLLISESLNKRMIVTIEEHSPFGGLASIISKILLENSISKEFMPFSLPDKFATISGSQIFLRNEYGLNTDVIVSRIVERLRD